MKPIILLVLSCCLLQIHAQEISLIPQPAEMKMPKTAGAFSLTPSTVIVLEGSGLENSANFFNDYLKTFYGFTLKIESETKSANKIVLNYEKMEYAIPGAYRMEVKSNEIIIAGDNENGTFYGIQTLIQLLPVQPAKALAIPFVSIKDYPRFGYRGMMLDVCRHFFPIDYVKKYLDYLAMHKMNYFHWHLTDDQGWRIEIKKYPKLTEVGGYRNGTIIGRFPGKGNDGIRYGGFYTQEEVKEIVKYAAERYITVIPEIEMPGHASAAIAAYPQLSCFPDSSTKVVARTAWNGPTQGKQVQQAWGVFEDVFAPTEFTFSFLQDVLDEVMPLFPAAYIHVGGDECPKIAWKKSAFCQQLIKEKNLKDEHGLQSYFIQRMEKYINGKGKKIIGWDEILEGGLAPNATVMSWRGEQGGIEAAKQNHNVIMTPSTYVYIDYAQTRAEDSVTIGGYIPLEKVYSYEPVPPILTAEQGKYILGAQGNLWTEYIGNSRKVEYMIFPRVSALSEVLWIGKGKKNYKDFEKRLQTQFKRYDLWKANYSKAYYDLKASVLPTSNSNGIQVKLESNAKLSKITYETVGKQNPVSYTSPIIIKKSAQIKAIGYSNNKQVSQVSLDFSINKASGKKIVLSKLPAAKWPGNGNAFGLVNGLKSANGISSTEWMGWENGGDMEAVIDLGSIQKISSVGCHMLEQQSSGIYKAAYVEAFVSSDGKNFTSVGKIDSFEAKSDRTIDVSIIFSSVSTRYVKIYVKNFGLIPDGQPSGGTKAWLFVDELEVN